MKRNSRRQYTSAAPMTPVKTPFAQAVDSLTKLLLAFILAGWLVYGLVEKFYGTDMALKSLGGVVAMFFACVWLMRPNSGGMMADANFDDAPMAGGVSERVELARIKATYDMFKLMQKESLEAQKQQNKQAMLLWAEMRRQRSQPVVEQPLLVDTAATQRQLELDELESFYTS